MLRRVVIGTLIGVILILGAFAWRQHEAIVTLQQDVRALPDLRRDNARLTSENHALRQAAEAREREASAAKSERPPPASDPRFTGALGNLRLITEARARGLMGVGNYFSPYPPFARMSPAFINAFNLTPEEVLALKERMADAERKIDALAAANATGARDKDGNFVITIKPTVEGGPVHDELLGAFRATLGEERYQYFLQLAGEQFERCLGYFGSQERTITIKRNPTGPAQFVIDEQSKAVTRDAGASGRTSPVADRQKLEAQFASLTKLFPPDL